MKPFRNIFSVVPDCHAATGHYRSLWRRHFYDGLRQEVDLLATPENVNFDWARTPAATEFSNKLRSETSETLWRQIKSGHEKCRFSAIISYCYSRDIEPELVKRTIKLGVPWINFYCDSVHRFSEVAELARVVSLNWFPEHAAIPKYHALGAPAVCLPYALNPRCLPDLSCRKPRYPMAFVGLPTTNRISQLGILRLLGCRVEIRGHGWVGGGADPFYSDVPNNRRFLKALLQPGLYEKVVRRLVWPLVRKAAGGPLSDDEFNKFLQECEVVLGLNQARDEAGEMNSYLKFRDLEFPGYGCCYLTEHNEDITKAFEIGREVLTYDSLCSAAKQQKEIRLDRARRLQIGSLGRRRVFADHNWTVRLGQLSAGL